MSLKCLFGHEWNGCICSRCGKTRDENHDWDGCVCRRCGKKKDENDLCHDWDGCTCKKCGLVRDMEHVWEDIIEEIDDGTEEYLATHDSRPWDDYYGATPGNCNLYYRACKKCGKRF